MEKRPLSAKTLREENRQCPLFRVLSGSLQNYLKMPKLSKFDITGSSQMGSPRQLQRPRVSTLEHRPWPSLPRSWLARPSHPEPAGDCSFLPENCPPWKGQRNPSWLALLLRPPPPEMFLFLILAWAGMWLHAGGQGAILGAPLPPPGFGQWVTPGLGF